MELPLIYISLMSYALIRAIGLFRLHIPAPLLMPISMLMPSPRDILLPLMSLPIC